MSSPPNPHTSRNGALIAGAAFVVLALAFHACDPTPPQEFSSRTTSSTPGAHRLPVGPPG
ncbi:hypothetical protein [Nocardia otitidiscaviarum]|uniref:hypothetical protein n=1 Tax=Nocardia otitidiscaviarum TaxID=1823 RepID=UPI00130DA1B0|nr:hypothetical protein [Nocardia otitidiscaviarum]